MKEEGRGDGRHRRQRRSINQRRALEGHTPCQALPGLYLAPSPISSWQPQGPSPKTHCAPECHRPCSRADPSACKTTPFPSLINSNSYFRPQVNVTSPLNSKTRLCPIEYFLCSIYNRWESFIYVIGGGWRSGGVMSVPVKYRVRTGTHHDCPPGSCHSTWHNSSQAGYSCGTAEGTKHKKMARSLRVKREG